MNSTLTLALRLALLPMLLGILAFVLWWLTGVAVIGILGALAIPFGLIATLLVAILIFQGVRQGRAENTPNARLRRHAGLIAVVMLANYPCCAGVMFLVDQTLRAEQAERSD
jgi:hypothetical protein